MASRLTPTYETGREESTMYDTIDRADAMYARNLRGARELAREWAQTDTRMTRVWTATTTGQTDTYKQEES